jgi:phosphocarrier protein HPr
MAVSKELTILTAVGLHARPAALFVRAAAAHKCKISVANLSKHTPTVNAKSLLSLLSIAVMQNEHILLTCEGEGEQQALDGLAALVAGNFGEGG